MIYLHTQQVRRYSDKALDEVMHYIDKALFRGMNQIEIVHGKGDGILKDQIYSYLNERSDVKSLSLPMKILVEQVVLW